MVTGDKTRGDKEPWLAAALSWFIIGAGHLYCGLYGLGAVLVVFGVLLGVLAILLILAPQVPLLQVVGPALAGSFIVHILLCVDAYKRARRGNSPDFERERASGKDPWLAALLSSILPGLGHAYLRRWVMGVLFFVGFMILAIMLGQSAFVLIGTTAAMIAVAVHAYVLALRRAPAHSHIPARWAAMLLTALMLLNPALELATKHLVVEVAITTAASMAPTIGRGTRVVVSKLVYRTQEPAVGDIIMFVPPENALLEDRLPILKRIVAVGGESVQIRNAVVYVDGQPRDPVPGVHLPLRGLPDEVLAHVVYGFTEPYRVPQGHYFVLGDSRENSIDSRAFGAVPRESIIGKAVKTFPSLRARTNGRSL